MWWGNMSAAEWKGVIKTRRWKKFHPDQILNDKVSNNRSSGNAYGWGNIRKYEVVKETLAEM